MAYHKLADDFYFLMIIFMIPSTSKINIWNIYCCVPLLRIKFVIVDLVPVACHVTNDCDSNIEYFLQFLYVSLFLLSNAADHIVIVNIVISGNRKLCWIDDNMITLMETYIQAQIEPFSRVFFIERNASYTLGTSWYATSFFCIIWIDFSI